MNRAEILSFLAKNPVCYLATVEAGEPRVRGMRMVRADDRGIVFQTGGPKELVRQLAANPAVEVCYYDPATNVQVRVRGAFEAVDDLALKKEIVEARPFLKPAVEQAGYDVILVYRMKDPLATVWTMETNLAPKSFVRL